MIQSKPPTDDYRSGWDRIFGGKPRVPGEQEEWCGYCGGSGFLIQHETLAHVTCKRCGGTRVQPKHFPFHDAYKNYE